MTRGSPFASNGRDDRLSIRDNKVSGVARSQIEVTCFLASSLISAWQNAPPPTEIMPVSSVTNLAITRRSNSRNLSSPYNSKISVIRNPLSSSIALSESTNPTFKDCANMRPRTVLPDPISPINISELCIRYLSTFKIGFVSFMFLAMKGRRPCPIIYHDMAQNEQPITMNSVTDEAMR